MRALSKHLQFQNRLQVVGLILNDLREDFLGQFQFTLLLVELRQR